MSAIMIAMTTINPNETDALNAYVEGVMPLITAADGQMLSRYEHKETLIGPESSQYVMIVEYPSAEAITTLFESADYKKLTAVRDTAFTSYNISIYEQS